MTRYYLTCRSLTYAQKASRVLDRMRIHNKIARTLQGMSSEGCGYALTIHRDDLARTIAALRENNLMPKRVFAVGDGTVEEVPM